MDARPLTEAAAVYHASSVSIFCEVPKSLIRTFIFLIILPRYKHTHIWVYTTSCHVTHALSWLHEWQHHMHL